MDNKKFFFSYSSTDAEFALKLAKDLRSVGADIWIDQLDILPAEKWDIEIHKALHSSDCILFIATVASVSSDNVLDEVNYALNNKKKVLPIIKTKCELPYRTSRLQHIDFTGDYDKGLAKLYKALSLVKKKEVESSKTENAGVSLTGSSENTLSEEEFWQKVVREDTLEAYNNYLQHSDFRKYSNEAHFRKEHLEETQLNIPDKQVIKDKKNRIPFPLILKVAIPVLLISGLLWVSINQFKKDNSAARSANDTASKGTDFLQNTNKKISSSDSSVLQNGSTAKNGAILPIEGSKKKGDLNQSPAIEVSQKTENKLNAKKVFKEGVALYDDGKYRESLIKFTRALQFDPDYIDAYINRGFAKQALGLHEESIEDYSYVIEIQPNYADAYKHRATAKSLLLRNEEVIKDLNKYIQLKPDYAKAYYERGYHKKAIGDTIEACKDFKKSCDLRYSDGCKEYESLCK